MMVIVNKSKEAAGIRRFCIHTRVMMGLHRVLGPVGILLLVRLRILILLLIRDRIGCCWSAYTLSALACVISDGRK